MTQYIGLIVAITIVAIVLELQRRSFCSTRKLINELNSLFPKFQHLEIKETLIHKDIIGNSEMLKSYVKNPRSKESIIQEDEYDEDNYTNVSLVVITGAASSRFTQIVSKTNMYLAKNTGTSADFGQIKEICESQLDSLINVIHNSLNVPLYLGLAGTFIGIITGLIGVDFNDIFANNTDGLQHLLYGVVCAMVASFVGLSLTIYNSTIAFKRTVKDIDLHKEDYYDFLRREIMPVLSNSMASSLNSLRGVLGHFVDKFGRNLDNYSESAELLNDNLEKQHLVLQQLNQLSLTRTANKIAETFVTLKDSSDSLLVFKSYQNSLNSTIDNMGATAEKIDKLFIQFDSMRNGLETIIENQSATTTLQKEFKTAIEENFPTGGEAREAWRKEFDTLIDDAQKTSQGLSEQLSLNSKYIGEFVTQNKDFFESFEKLKEVLATMVQYTNVQAECYKDLKQEINQMRGDYKESQKESVATNRAVLEAVKEMIKAIKVINSFNHGN